MVILHKHKSFSIELIDINNISLLKCPYCHKHMYIDAINIDIYIHAPTFT